MFYTVKSSFSLLISNRRNNNVQLRAGHDFHDDGFGGVGGGGAGTRSGCGSSQVRDAVVYKKMLLLLFNTSMPTSVLCTDLHVFA